MIMYKCFLLLLLPLFVHSSYAQTPDSLSQLEVGNLSYVEGELRIKFVIGKSLDGMRYDERLNITRSYTLPDYTAKAYRAMVNEVGILDIVSSDASRCLDCLPFVMRYTIYGRKSEVRSTLSAMTEEQRTKRDRYEERKATLIDLTAWEKKFHDELPDGYYVRLGRMGYWPMYRKKDGQFGELKAPIYILNGHRISIDEFERLDLSKGQYRVTTLAEGQAAALYGGAGRFGAVLIESTTAAK